MTPDYGVIVGRFQVPDLHEGHLELLTMVRSLHQRILVFVGVAPTLPTYRNPLDFESRKRMIQSHFPEFIVLPLPDQRTDEYWSVCLDREISKLVPSWGTATLYGARDSFLPHYKGTRAVKELLLKVKMTGSEVRNLQTNYVRGSADFRAGIIHSVNNQPPRVYTTVDVAVLYDGVHPSQGEGLYLLLGTKRGFPGKYRFIGGFAEPYTTSFETDAMREVWEETNIALTSPMAYLGSRQIDDWRYTQDSDQIKSLLFTAYAPSLSAKAGDDLETLNWFQFEGFNEQLIVEEHLPFLNILREHIRRIREKQSTVTDR